jgi:hypothetical protein
MSETVRAKGSGVLLESVFGDARDTLSGSVARERSGRVKYWKRFPDGWIARGPDIRTDPPKWQQFTMTKKWRELPDSFGIEVQGVAGGTIQPNHPARGGQEHHWLLTFFRNGGLTYVCTEADTFGKVGEYAMPAEQIVSMGLHRDPEILKLRPDLEEAVDLECPYEPHQTESGERRLFSAMTHADAQKKVDQHVVAVHKDAIASKAVGNAIAAATADKSGQSINPELIAQIVAATVAALKGVDAGAVAAVATAKEEKPAGPRYPEGFPAPDWKRQELMAWAKDNGYQIPENRMQMSRDDWYNYIVNPVAPEPEEEEYAELVEA